MKNMFVCLITVFALGVAAHAADWDSDYSRLLKKYVTPGGVKYAAWKANAEDVAALKKVTDAIAAAPSPGKGTDGLAFYLNAYNAWIIQEVLERYPTKSVKDTLMTFFTKPRFTVAGEKMSFNRLEKDIIRPRFNEPRIHFALNCASQSCPPLRAEAYSAGKLDSQLDQQSRAFVDSPNGVKVSGKSAELSKIFDWYKDDFGGAPALPGYVNKYRSAPLPAGTKIAFQEYDWSLNEAK